MINLPGNRSGAPTQPVSAVGWSSGSGVDGSGGGMRRRRKVVAEARDSTGDDMRQRRHLMWAVD
jgi:hypothetical protein